MAEKETDSAKESSSIGVHGVHSPVNGDSKVNEKALVLRADFHILPIISIIYVLAFIDRYAIYILRHLKKDGCTIRIRTKMHIRLMAIIHSASM